MQYFSDKYPFSIRSLIMKYRNWVCFFWFILDSLRLFSINIALMLSWWQSSSSTAYTCPSINYLYHRHCGKASSAPTVSASAELPPSIFCFHDSSIIDPVPMDIIAPVCPLKSGWAAKDASTYHLITLRLLELSMSGRCRVPLMYLSTLTRFH